MRTTQKDSRQTANHTGKGNIRKIPRNQNIPHDNNKMRKIPERPYTIKFINNVRTPPGTDANHTKGIIGFKKVHPDSKHRAIGATNCTDEKEGEENTENRTIYTKTPHINNLEIS